MLFPRLMFSIGMVGGPSILAMDRYTRELIPAVFFSHSFCKDVKVKVQIVCLIVAILDAIGSYEIGTCVVS